MKLSEAIELLAIATRADGRSPRTVQSYRQKLAPLVKFLDDVEIETITIYDLRRYVADLWDRTYVYSNHPIHGEKRRRLSPFTIASRVRHMKRLFNWLEEEGILDHNPATRIKTPKPKRKKPKGISPEDFRRLLKTTENESPKDLRDRAAMMLLYDTGCRAGGLCGIKVKDLDFDELLVTVTEKGGRTRIVPFTQESAEALQAWLEVRPQDRGQWVFVALASQSTGALSPNSLWQVLDQRGEKGGAVSHVNPHSFRHAFARDFIIDGGDLATLADLMGNSIEVIIEYYAIFKFRELQKKHLKHNPLLRVLQKEEEDEED